MMRQALKKCTTLPHIHNVMMKRSNIIVSNTRRHAASIKEIDFTQSPGEFMKTLDQLVTPQEAKPTSSAPTSEHDITLSQQVYQVLSLNSHLQTRNATLLSQAQQLVEAAKNEPALQEKALERFKKIVNADPANPETTDGDSTPLHLRDPMQGITTRQELQERFETIHNLFEHVTETASKEGFHQAAARLLELNSPLFSLLSDTKYHNYPPIYTIDAYLTRINNAFHLGDYERAEKSCDELIEHVKTVSAQVDRAVAAKKRREALETAEFRSSGKYGDVAADVEADFEELRKRYYTVSSKWNVYGVTYPEFDPILGIEQNTNLVIDHVNAYATQASIAKMEILLVSNQVDKAEQYLLNRLEDPTLENTYANALDLGVLATIKASQSQFESAVTYFSKAIKQLLAFPKTSVLRTVYEIMLMQAEHAIGKRDIGADILALNDRLATEESIEVQQYIRTVIIDLLLSRNNSKALRFIDESIALRQIPSERIVSFDYPSLLKRRAEALSIDLDVSDKKRVAHIRQIFEQAIEIMIQQTGENSHRIPLLYDAFANFSQLVGDEQSAQSLRSKRDAVNQHNKTTTDLLKIREKFLFTTIGLSLPREQFTLEPTENTSAFSRSSSVDSLQKLNQLRTKRYL